MTRLVRMVRDDLAREACPPETGELVRRENCLVRVTLRLWLRLRAELRNPVEPRRSNVRLRRVLWEYLATGELWCLQSDSLSELERNVLEPWNLKLPAVR